jgi:hypothetical protein
LGSGLDNADNKLDFFPGPDGCPGARLAKYIPTTSEGTVIITTRDCEVAHQLAGPRGILTKEAMGIDDSRELFYQHYPSEVPSTIDCTELLQEFHYLPLAIAQVGSYLAINRHTITPSRYLKMFRAKQENRRRLLSNPVNNPRDYIGVNETVLTTFSITFQLIRVQSPLAYSILRTISYTEPQQVPHDIFTVLEGGDDEIMLDEALAKLCNFSLLHMSTERDARSYTVHSLVDLALQSNSTPQEVKTDLENTAQYLAKSMPLSCKFEYWPILQQYLPHAETFLRHVTGPDTIHIASIYGSMAAYLTATGRYRDALPLAQRSVEIKTCLLGKEHLGTLMSMNNLAVTLSGVGRQEEAEDLQIRVVHTGVRVLAEEHTANSTFMGTLATIYHKQGRMKDARLFFCRF